jgi:hypothetical protein
MFYLQHTERLPSAVLARIARIVARHDKAIKPVEPPQGSAAAFAIHPAGKIAT